MEISWGFLIAFVLILFPGLIFRRLYFYGEFSKQFSSGLSLIKLISVASIPGLFILISIFFFYDNLISEIDLESIINTFKVINNPGYILPNTPELSIKEKLNSNVLPFLGFLYFSSILLGLLSGRLVRITGIDSKFKLLRFKNHWFYLFNGEHHRFKKMRHLRNDNQKHLFTKADILIDSNNKTHLYSGVVVDYELKEGDCQTLSKVMLQNAERYSLKNGKKTPVIIPGNLLIVDCSHMKNINLTFINEEKKELLKSKIPRVINGIFITIIILLIPFLIFQTDYITWQPYVDFFKKQWYIKMLYYLLITQCLSILNPFSYNKENDYYEYVEWKIFVAKAVWIVLLFFLFWIL